MTWPVAWLIVCHVDALAVVNSSAVFKGLLEDECISLLWPVDTKQIYSQGTATNAIDHNNQPAITANSDSHSLSLSSPLFLLLACGVRPLPQCWVVLRELEESPTAVDMDEYFFESVSVAFCV